MTKARTRPRGLGLRWILLALVCAFCGVSTCHQMMAKIQQPTVVAFQQQ